MPYVINAYDDFNATNHPFGSTESDYDVFNETNNTLGYAEHAQTATSNQTELHVDYVLFHSIHGVFIAGRYIHLIWYMIGFFGNVISAMIWLQPKMLDVCSSAQYLVALAICDIICLGLHFFFYLKTFWQIEAFYGTSLCEYMSLLYMVPQYIGQLLVIGYTLDKLRFVKKPFSGDRYADQTRATKTIVWIVIIVTVMVFPQAFFWKGYCDAQRAKEYPIWNWISLMVVYMVTPILALTLNCRIIYVLRNPDLYAYLNQNQKEFALHIYEKFKSSVRESIHILVTLSLFRMFSLFPDTVIQCLFSMDYFESMELSKVYTMADVQHDAQWQMFTRVYATMICFDIIAASHLSLSVVIYCLTSPTFRNELYTRVKAVKHSLVEYLIAKYRQCVTFLHTLQEEN